MHYRDAILHRTRHVLWWPGAVSGIFGVVLIVLAMLAARVDVPTYLVQNTLLAAFCVFLASSLLLLIYWILTGHIYPPLGWLTASEPSSAGKRRRLDEMELAYGSLDKDGFELFCGGVIFHVLRGSIWLFLPVLLSSIFLLGIMWVNANVDAGLVPWSLLMLFFNVQRAVLFRLRSEHSLSDMLKQGTIVKMFLEGAVAGAAIAVFSW